MNFIKRNQLVVIGVIPGAIGGYLYYHFVGCVSGTCTITSKPVNSSLYGALMGGIFLSIFQKDKKSENKTNLNEEK